MCDGVCGWWCVRGSVSGRVRVGVRVSVCVCVCVRVRVCVREEYIVQYHSWYCGWSLQEWVKRK